ncbi:hypothetical protein D3C73_1488840 [compost metagenome]
MPSRAEPLGYQNARPAGKGGKECDQCAEQLIGDSHNRHRIIRDAADHYGIDGPQQRLQKNLYKNRPGQHPQSDIPSLRFH